MALIQNGAAIPKLPTITPPNAGPTARLTLTPALFAAIAGWRSCLGTSCGTIVCQAGTVSAPAAPMRKVNSNRLTGVASPNETIPAYRAERTVKMISATMRNLRLSTMSAIAPAGNANRNIGRVVATWTIDTMNGSGLRLVISQPDAALYIQLPMFETTVAVHSTENAA